MRNTVLVLSIVLQRGNGLMIRKGMQKWRKAAGRQFVHVLPQPIAEVWGVCE